MRRPDRDGHRDLLRDGLVSSQHAVHDQPPHAVAQQDHLVIRRRQILDARRHVSRLSFEQSGLQATRLFQKIRTEPVHRVGVGVGVRSHRRLDPSGNLLGRLGRHRSHLLVTAKVTVHEQHRSPPASLRHRCGDPRRRLFSIPNQRVLVRVEVRRWHGYVLGMYIRRVTALGTWRTGGRANGRSVARASERVGACEHTSITIRTRQLELDRRAEDPSRVSQAQRGEQPVEYMLTPHQPLTERQVGWAQPGHRNQSRRGKASRVLCARRARSALLRVRVFVLSNGHALGQPITTIRKHSSYNRLKLSQLDAQPASHLGPHLLLQAVDLVVRQ